LYKIREVQVDNFSKYRLKLKLFTENCKIQTTRILLKMRVCIFWLVRKKLLPMNERRKSFTPGKSNELSIKDKYRTYVPCEIDKTYGQGTRTVREMYDRTWTEIPYVKRNTRIVHEINGHDMK